MAEIGDMMSIQVIIEGSMNSSNPYFSSIWRRNFNVCLRLLPLCCYNSKEQKVCIGMLWPIFLVPFAKEDALKSDRVVVKIIA